MRFPQQVIVTGIKQFKGEVDGKSYDSFKVFLQIPLDESKGTAKGYGVDEFNAGQSEEFDKWKHLPFPVQADAVMEMVTTGKLTRLQVVEVKPRKAA